MPIISSSWLADFESNMQILTETEYDRLTKNLWFQNVVKERPSKTKRELVSWLLSTAQITPQGLGGNARFDDMVSAQTEFTNQDSGAGLVIRRQELEDLDGNGIDVATRWAADIGAYMAYYPQKLTYAAMLAGTSALAYDGKAYFATDHPCNPNGGSVTYSNLIGSVPISTAVTADVALTNLSTVFGAIGSIKMPNGVDPRMLRPKAIMCSPKLYPRLVQLTSAKFLAQGGAGGAGSGDVSSLISALGFGTPIMLDEMAGDDTSYYVLAEQATSSQLGALVYVNREPYKITYYTGQGGGDGVDAKLDRMQELEWHCHGRNVVGYGHPFLLFKCTA